MNRQGYTLVELMITTAIIIILSALILPKMADVVRVAIEGRTRANLAIVRHAILAYYGDFQRYPTDHLGDLIDKGYLPHGLPMIAEPPYHADGNGVCTGPLSVDTFVACNDAYVYDNDPNSPTWGIVVLTCIHQDSRGRVWSSY